jgi:hypothetical protein
MRMKVLLAAMVMLLGALLALLFLLLTTPILPQPGSYLQSVQRLLRARNLKPRKVDVVDSCAPTVERCRTYSGVVTIDADTHLSGQIDCRERWTSCSLTMPMAHLDHTPLPDVIDPLAWRWQLFLIRVRAWLSGLNPIQVLIPAFAASGGPNFWAIAGWHVLFVRLGLVLHSEAGARQVVHSMAVERCTRNGSEDSSFPSCYGMLTRRMNV